MRTRMFAAAALAGFIALSVGSVSAATAAYPGGPDGPPADCQVRDFTSRFPAPATSLQQAVDQASNGDVLVIKGLCVGITVINKNLTVMGYRSNLNATWSRKNIPIEVLDGAGMPGSVVTIAPGAQVTLKYLVVEGGTGSPHADSSVLDGTFGGGIDNYGTLTLVSDNITENIAGKGGGIFNEPGATLIGSGNHAKVQANDANFGGGVYLDAGSTAGSGGLWVLNNVAQQVGGGVYVHPGATFTAAFGFGDTLWEVAGNSPDNVFVAPTS
jgi:hypothetical protein